MSRRSRCTVKVKQTIDYSESSNESEASDSDENFLDLLMTLQQTRYKRRRSGGRVSRKRNSTKHNRKISTPKRASNKLKATAGGRNITVTSTTTLPLLSPSNNVNITTSIILDDSTVKDHSKKVQEKVESFFKAHNLISDDEDDTNESVKPKCPPKETKEFYELSDSEDDIKLTNFSPVPSTSFAGVDNHKELACENIKSLIDIPELKSEEPIDLIETPAREDELMDVVDKILENTDNSVNTSDKDHSWTDYKSKAEEILGNISNLLNEISKDANPKPVETKPPTTIISEPARPSCPVCFEPYGCKVTAMTTTCGHIFCKTCIEHVAKTVKKCPTCRKAVNLKKIHAIYL